jgi:hypothetical protein
MNIGAAAKLACSYWRRRPQHASGMHVLWSMRRRKHCAPITCSKWQWHTHTHDDMEWKSVARSIDLCSQYRTLPSIGCVLARPSMHASGAVNYSAQQSNMLIWNGRIALASPNRPFMTTPRWIDMIIGALHVDGVAIFAASSHLLHPGDAIPAISSWARTNSFLLFLLLLYTSI